MIKPLKAKRIEVEGEVFEVITGFTYPIFNRPYEVYLIKAPEGYMEFGKFDMYAKQLIVSNIGLPETLLHELFEAHTVQHHCRFTGNEMTTEPQFVFNHTNMSVIIDEVAPLYLQLYQLLSVAVDEFSKGLKKKDKKK